MIDVLFHIVYGIVTGLAFFVAYDFGMIPATWLHIALAIVIIIWLISILLALKKLAKWVTILRWLFLLIIIIFLSISGYFLHKSRNTLDRISQNHTSIQQGIDDVSETIEKMYIVVNANSDKQSIHDLKDGIVGFQTTSDQDCASYMQAELEKTTTFEVYESMDYTSLMYQLTNDTISGVGISKKYYDMTIANDEALEDQLRIVHTFEREMPKNISLKDITKEPFTIYLSGLDNVGSPDQQTRTDTNLILIVNPRAKHIDMVSLPRDGYVPNTALAYQNDKLTHTGMFGIQASVDTIENFFQIPIDYYARVSFNSLIQIVDIMDGVNVDVEIDFCEQDENRSFKKEDLVCLSKGQQILNGKEALAYSRHRKTPGYENAGRQRAQRRIIKAMIDKLFSANALGYINELLDEAPNYVITNMPTSDIANFISHELENLGAWSISTIPSDTGVYDFQYVASISPAEGPKSVYLFSKYEVQALLNTYDGAKQPLQMQDYSFDLNNIYQDCPAINSDPNIVWDEMMQNQMY